MKTLLKKALLIVALVSSAISAHADLGDTYRTSCQRYGGKGQISQTTKGIGWDIYGKGRTPCYVLEQFYKNQCVAIVYSINVPIADSEVWRMLIINSNNGIDQTWTEYNDGINERAFATADGKLLADISHNGSVLRIAYKSWLVAHNLLVPPNSQAGESTAPVDEANNGITL